MESRTAYFDLVDESASIGQFDMDSTNGFGDSASPVGLTARPIKTNALLAGQKGGVIKLLLLLVFFFIGILLGAFVLRNRTTFTAASVMNKTDVVCSCGVMQAWNHYSPALFQTAQEQVTSSFILAEMRAVSSSRAHGNHSFQDQLTSAIVGQWRLWNLDSVQLDKHTACLYSISIRLLRKSDQLLFTAKLASSTLNDYSKMADLRTNYVYAHYGRQEDFKVLALHNISCEGRLLLLRIGHVSVSTKVRQAKLVGAVGFLLFPEPVDYAHNFSALFGADGVTWHGHMDVKDSFLVESISWMDAKQLLDYLAGPAVPTSWTPGLASRLGPASESLGVQLVIRDKCVPLGITNVVGRLRGSEEPDRWVVLSASRDSVSATAILQQLVSILGAELKRGWRPRRTIVFILSELGQLGTAQYFRRNSARLAASTVALIFLDSPVQGAFALTSTASLLLRRVLANATRSVTNLRGDVAALTRSTISDSGDADNAGKVLSLEFGIPFVRAQFTAQDPYLRANAQHDTVFDVLAQVDDRNLTLHVQIARLNLDLLLRLSDSAILTYDLDSVMQRLRAIGAAVRRKLATLVEISSVPDVDATLQRFEVSLDDFSLAVVNFYKFGTNVTFLSTSWRAVRLLNDALRSVPRCFLTSISSQRGDLLTPTHTYSDLPVLLDTGLTELLLSPRSNSTANFLDRMDLLNGAVLQATHIVRSGVLDAASTF